MPKKLKESNIKVIKRLDVLSIAALSAFINAVFGVIFVLIELPFISLMPINISNYFLTYSIVLVVTMSFIGFILGLAYAALYNLFAKKCPIKLELVNENDWILSKDINKKNNVKKENNVKKDITYKKRKTKRNRK